MLANNSGERRVSKLVLTRRLYLDGEFASAAEQLVGSLADGQQ